MSRHSSKFSSLLLALPLAAGLLASTTIAQAQTSPTAKIPFAFSANNQHVPAGTYKISLLSDRFMCLRNVETTRTQCLMVRPESGQVIESQSRLIFNHSGRSTSLAQVWMSGTSVHSELISRPRRESELAKGALSSGSSIEIAMK